MQDGHLLKKGHASSPAKADSDKDGLNDTKEKAAGSHPLMSDSDTDGLTDIQELRLNRNSPVNPDIDGGDGFNDSFELSSDFDPTQAASTPDAISTILPAAEFRFNAEPGGSTALRDRMTFKTWLSSSPAS